MSDTIELLETIGKNSTLRYASADELASVLEQAGASEGVKAAVKHADSALLSRELGQQRMHVDHATQTPAHEEEEEEQEKEPELVPVAAH